MVIKLTSAYLGVTFNGFLTFFTKVSKEAVVAFHTESAFFFHDVSFSTK